MLRLSFFKNAAKLANNYKEFNSFRRGIAAPFIAGGVSGGMILGANVGLLNGMTHSVSDYCDKKRVTFNSVGKVADFTWFGGFVGALSGFGVCALALLPEVAFVGSVGFLAYTDHLNREENSKTSLRR